MTGHVASRVSLRARLVVLSLLLVISALTVVNVVMYGGMNTSLLQPLDDGLFGATVDKQHQDPKDVAVHDRQFSSIHAGNDMWFGALTVYLDAGGRVVQEQPFLQSPGRPVLPRLDRADVDTRAGRAFSAPGTDGVSWRLVALPRGAGSVVSGTSLRSIYQQENRAVAVWVLTDLAVLVVLGIIGWFAAGAALRPLRRVEHTTTAIAGGDYTRRLPDSVGPRTEVGRLTVAINSMLEQIETAFAARTASEQRMRRFIADASHEMRTPLFGISGSAELYRMGAVEDAAHSLARIEGEARRLGALVNDLLLLTQYDEPSSGLLRKEPMDLRTLAVDAMHDLAALDRDRPVELTGPGSGPPKAAPTLGDEAKLRQVVLNLIGNAVAHTPKGSPVRIGVGTIDDTAVLEVADTGLGLTEEQRQRVFDRFYRADPSRTRHTGGAGLGLSIVHSLVTAYGGTIEIDSVPGEGATFRIRLPIAASAMSAGE